MVLILGGYDKAADFSALLPLIRQKVHHVITMGATEEKICQMLQSHGYTAIAKGGDDFDKVTELACEAARPGDVVMLSPACASWGMFANFEARGDRFRSLILQRCGGQSGAAEAGKSGQRCV